MGIYRKQHSQARSSTSCLQTGTSWPDAGPVRAKNQAETIQIPPQPELEDLQVGYTRLFIGQCGSVEKDQMGKSKNSSYVQKN